MKRNIEKFDGTTLPEPKNPVVAGVNETPNVPADGSGGRGIPAADCGGWGGDAAGDKENGEIMRRQIPGHFLR